MRTVEIYEAASKDPMDGLRKVETITVERSGEGYVARHEDGSPINSERGKYNSLFDLVRQVAAYNGTVDDGKKMVIRKDDDGLYWPTVISRGNYLWERRKTK